MRPQVNIIKKKILPLLKSHDVIKAGVFGSYARGENTKNSDIDILIEYGVQGKSLLDLIRLERELKKLTGKKVDVLTYKGLNKYIKKEILKQEIRIL